MVDVVNKAKNVAIPEVFSDLDIFMEKHPVTGDILRKTDADAIKRSVRNIVLTNKFERPFKPNFGSSLRGMLFELNDERSAEQVGKKIKQAIETLEPRVRNVFLVATPNKDSNEMHVTVNYTIKASARSQQVEFKLTRTR